MAQLLCEGRCNGQTITRADAFIRQQNDHPKFGRLVLDETENPYRGCVYTTHRELPSGRYACVDCGAERQYGVR